MKIELDKLVKFIRTEFKHIPEFKIEEYIRKKKANGSYYTSIQSNNQIRTIYKYRNEKSKYYFSLISLFNHYFNEKLTIQDIQYIIKNNKTDYDIYMAIRNWNKKHTSNKKYYKRKIHRTEHFNNIIKHTILTNYKITNYLDVGCGSGQNTYLIGKYLKLDQEDVYCADIDDWFNIGDKRMKYIKNFDIIKNDRLPYPDNKFSFISCLMVLHHVQNLEKMIKEIYRVLKPGGYLFIIDHSAMSDFDKLIIDIQHSIFEIVYNNSKTKEKYYNEYYAEYYDRYQWHYIMHLHKFKLVKSGFKSESIRFEISPVRHFYAVYQKV